MILNYGCAGAHRPDLKPGDVVVGTHTTPLNAVKALPDGGLRPAGFRRFDDRPNETHKECGKARSTDGGAPHAYWYRR